MVSIVSSTFVTGKSNCFSFLFLRALHLLSRVSPQVRNLLLNVSLLSVGVADQLNECVSLVQRFALCAASAPAVLCYYTQVTSWYELFFKCNYI